MKKNPLHCMAAILGIQKQPPVALQGTTRQEVADYWTRHNVTLHKQFDTREASLDYFHWRCDQYPGYLSLMPVSGHANHVVLDYGCGPGNDLVGFAEYSAPQKLIGCDVSPTSLQQAKTRMQLHPGVTAETILLSPESQTTLPLADNSVDYIHSSGVLHHVEDLNATLRELHRVLKPGGKMRVMVYNEDSVWMHLYVAYVLRYQEQRIPPELPIREAFRQSTDGMECPIAHCYRYDDFAYIAQTAGFKAEYVGVACALFERELALSHLNKAAMDPRLERHHRDFLLALTFDTQLIPHYQGRPAGIDLVIELRK